MITGGDDVGGGRKTAHLLRQTIIYINLCYHKERKLVNAGRWISKKEWKFPGKPDKIEIWRRPIKLLHLWAEETEDPVTILQEITHRHTIFGRKLHKHEELCCLTKRFWDTTEGLVEHAQNMTKNLGDLFYCEQFGRWL